MNCKRVDDFRTRIALTALGVPMTNPLAVMAWGTCEAPLELGRAGEDTGMGPEEGKACGMSASGVPGTTPLRLPRPKSLEPGSSPCHKTL